MILAWQHKILTIRDVKMLLRADKWINPAHFGVLLRKNFLCDNAIFIQIVMLCNLLKMKQTLVSAKIFNSR